ncbi:RNA-binding protein [Danxiaibacter flavus]|uniref:RNA-binding protein n=1 Tax=Danxiaibacter flavus TaxID=3049108 RepID=A0ABV3ZIX6_9BACT|nr:RNA-binding protein [Chitinophagaceae bacterium DXS]
MNIYVSNLGFQVTESDLKNLFAKHGQVSSVRVITDKFTGDSRGFAFVEMSSDEEGRKAIQSLNEQEVQGRRISVSVAREKTQNSGFTRARSPWKD